MSDPYTYDVSSEHLDAIRYNECEARPGLTTSRFRRLWNELAAANEARDALRAEVERLRALMARILEEPSNTMSDAKALREIIRMVKAQTAIVAARKGA